MADSAKEEYSGAPATVLEVSTTSSASNTAEEGMWSAVKESLRGSHRNYTVGPIGRSIILLAIPDGSRDAHGECVCCRRYFLGSTSGN